MKQNIQQIDRVRGSLIGGAVGDALGYPVEFMESIASIQKHYGKAGITRLDTSLWWTAEPDGKGKAVVSDDTQMTLFTACGLLNAMEKGLDPVQSIGRAYIEWYFTQLGEKNNKFKDCWIRDVPELYVRRAPGNTCINALAALLAGKDASNSSKGCGGVMRIAPIALYGAAQSRITDIEVIDRLAADASKITHKHPLGYIPSALVAHLIYRLVEDENPSRETTETYIKEGLATLQKLYPNNPKEVEYFTSLIERAIALSHADDDDASTIETQLGGGWVAEETAAIAIYATLKYFDDFEKAMIASVNHGGDSDSTGAVAGNILGAAVGYNSIPAYYKTDLQFRELILHIADDIYQGKTTLP